MKHTFSTMVSVVVALVFVLTGCTSQPTPPPSMNSNTVSAVSQPQSPTSTPESVTTKPVTTTNTNTVKLKPKVTTAPVAPKPRTMVLTMEARNDSGENGTATLTDQDGKTKVSISLNHAPSIDPQPAYIYTGACGGGGKIRHTLNYLVKGQSSTVLLFSLDQILNDKPLSINVHKNQSDILTSVSCANIE